MEKHAGEDAVAAARFMERAIAEGRQQHREPAWFELSSATWEAIGEWLGPLRRDDRFRDPPRFMGVEVHLEDALKFCEVVLVPGEAQRVPHVRVDGSVEGHPVGRRGGELPRLHEVDYRLDEARTIRVTFELRIWVSATGQRNECYVEAATSGDALQRAVEALSKTSR